MPIEARQVGPMCEVVRGGLLEVRWHYWLIVSQLQLQAALWPAVVKAFFSYSTPFPAT